MKGRLLDISYGVNRKQRLTVELDGDFRASFDALKDFLIDIDIKKHREKRSANANAYFHLLVGRIAEVRGLGFDEVKRQLVCEYLMLYIIQERAKELIVAKEVTLEDRRSLTHWHDVYHVGLGGNGDADALMNEVMHLPIKAD